MSTPVVNLETVKLLAGLQGLSVPDEDLQPLAEALTGHLATVAAIVDRYELDDVEPVLTHDPRWS
jgi:hypothetical protein